MCFYARLGSSSNPVKHPKHTLACFSRLQAAICKMVIVIAPTAITRENSFYLLLLAALVCH
eukprot:m.5236 g.5236  ORF g.5236 m.5236 type:complete len:61 (+) comp3542_c0_seq1:59-241(+)